MLTLSRRLRRQWLPLAALVAVASLMLLHAHVYASFLSDDALISLRYARRLVEGHGMTWTDGERVEGYTDLLWVLLVAAGARAHADCITAALALDHAGVLLAVAAVGLSARTGTWSTARLLTGGGLLAASVPMAVWANGGLEHGWMTGVLGLGLFLVERGIGRGSAPRWTTGLPLAALAMLRADGILLGVLAVGGAVTVDALTGGLAGLRAGRALRAARRWAPVAAPMAVAVAAQLAFRRLYYGQWQPNTALAKLAFNHQRLLGGLDYLSRGYRATAVLVALALVATVLPGKPWRSFAVIRWTVILGWTGYLAAVGGDIFPGWRQLIFVFVPLAFFAADLAERAAGRADGRPRWIALGVVVLATGALARAHLLVQNADSENRRAAYERWEWDGVGVGALLKEAFGSRAPLLAVDAAGALPYWSGLPSLDMLGLNDSYIAHHPPPTFGHGEIGHELGDGAYVLRRAPDIIAFDNAAGSRDPNFLSGRQLLSMPEFRRSYQWIRVEPMTGNRARGELWVRREGGRLGVVRSGDRIDVPGYFATGAESDSVARPDERGGLVAEASEGRYAVLPALEIPAGRWRLTIEPPDADGRVVAFRCETGSVQPLGPSGDVIAVERNQALSVAVAPRLGSTGTTPIERLTFTRASDDAPSFRCLPAGQPLSVPLDALSARKPDHLPWAHPANLVVGSLGLVVKVDEARRVRAIELSADNDDGYGLEIRRGAEVLWRGEAGPSPNGGGLASRRILLPREIVLEKGDLVAAAPVSGDGRSSVGHLVLEP